MRDRLSSVSDNNKIVTLEGLGTPENPHPVQRAFIEEQAAQCGYCINGMIMEAAAFLAANRRPSEADIKNALASNLCRCGTHVRIVRAVKRAADTAQARSHEQEFHSLAPRSAQDRRRAHRQLLLRRTTGRDARARRGRGKAVGADRRSIPFSLSMPRAW